jgi:cyanophycinase-like exopeptidase
MSQLVIMGSGETAPTMVPVHREVFAATPPGPAVMLDTTFGFQLNADELVSRTGRYFAESIGKRIDVATWRYRDDDALQREKSLAALAQATWAFAGPGSPTFALRQWVDTPVPAALADVVRRGGTLVMGSAAVVTLGVCAIPVYEIYKAGIDPYLADGLDLLGALTGVKAMVIPHYDNAEGGSHDTRFCYLGEQRLELLERRLPADVGVLGVDEHTALLIDLDTKTAAVKGNHVVTVRRRGESREFATGDVLPLAELAALLQGAEKLSGHAIHPTAATPQASEPAESAELALTTSLHDATVSAREAFDAAHAARDVDGCVAAILSLESAIHDWSTDTLQSSDVDDARRALRALVVRLGELARAGVKDPRAALAPFVEELLSLRALAREGGDFATSDQIRDRLADARVEVRDTPTGVEWELLSD